MAELAHVLALLPYEREIVAYLKDAEPDLWSWFSSTTYREDHAASVRRELLKASYRFERKDHADLYALADGAALALGVAVPVVLYQAQAPGAAMNAGLCYVPGEAHVLLQGPIQASLAPPEIASVLAHELTHLCLWESHGGDLLVADQMLSAMSLAPEAAPSHVESARLLRLYLEIHADRGALHATGDVATTVAALVKVETGLSQVSGASYLAQAEEIFRDGRVVTEELTHPEAFVRARALALWHATPAAADDAIAPMIEGPLRLEPIDLLGQRRLTELTRAILQRFLVPAWARSDALLAHARSFFDDLDVPATAPHSLAADLKALHASLHPYLCYLLLDLATAERGLEELPMAAALSFAEEIGIDKRFRDLAAKETGTPKRELRALQRRCGDVLARAGGGGPS